MEWLDRYLCLVLVSMLAYLGRAYRMHRDRLEW